MNADDFGFSAGISAGIIRAHKEGIVTSTTVAANMPAAEQAIALLADTPALGVGVHLNACQGPPLSREGSALAGDDGQMRRRGFQLVLACIRRPRLLDVVAAEFEAQIRWLIDRGIRVTHLDSHRHVHAWPPVFRRVARLASRYDIGFVRRLVEKLPRGPWPPSPAKQRRTRWVLNRLALAAPAASRRLAATLGTWGIAHTGLITAAYLACVARAAEPGVTEIMTHPGQGDDVAEGVTRLIEARRAELAALCDPSVRQAFEDSGIELTHYGRL
ncbi:MAG: ChbG/HpnK family deacetylase [Phycisphaerae bacterium]|nr:ChbG/HpnK family deacetylase [Phycisphaerae bacterium]